MEPLNCGQFHDVAHPKCPLCGSIDTLCKTRISSVSIVELYGTVQQELVRQELQGTSWIYVYHCGRCCLCFFEPIKPGSPAFYASLQSFRSEERRVGKE